MRKRFIVFIALFLLAACSSNSNNNNETNNNVENQNHAENENEDKPLEVERLFEHNSEESGSYNIQAIQTDKTGSAITFTGLEEIDRAEEYYTYIIDQNDDVFEVLELAEDEDQDRRCTDLQLSPNGDTLLYNCHDDGIEFSLYDMNEEETIHQMDELDDYIMDVHGITNDQVVYYEITNDDYQVELIAYDAKTDEKTSYILEDTIGFDEEKESFDEAILTDDGEYLLLNTVTALYLFDIEAGSTEEIVNVDEYIEEYDTDIFLYNVEMSPDAKYIHYQISDNDPDPIYSETFFHNLETDEVTTYREFDYESIRGFDEDYNLLLADKDELFLYNAESEETHIIPDIEVSNYTGYFTLTHNSEYLLYADRELNEDDTFTHVLNRVTLGDTSAYETTELKAEAEKVTEEPDEDEIALTEANFDEKDIFTDLMDSSTDFMYPTEFPHKIDRITHHLSGSEDDRRYAQSITMDSDSRNNEISFTGLPKDDPEDECLGFDELEVVDTIDGNDYYFYDFDNRDVEAAVAVDDVCYTFAAEEHSKEDMLNMAQSLEPIDDPVRELELDELKFPTLFPIDDPNTGSPRITVFDDEDKTDFIIGYNAEYDDRKDSDLSMKFEIRSNEPKLFDADENHSVDIDGFEESYIYKDYKEIMMYDGTHYYIIKLDDIDKDMIAAFGEDHIEDTFVKLGNSLE